MPERAGRIYCQRCLAANALGQESCAKCGTRLMLVIEPSALRYEEETGGGESHDEYLLERLTMLENRLGRVTEKLEQGFDLLLRQARTSYVDHVLLETLVGALSESRAIDYDRFHQIWRRRCERDADKMAQQERRDRLRERILAHYKGREQETFARLVKEGFAHLEKDEKPPALRALERAAALAPTNAPLNSFLGEHFFVARKMVLARDYLERARAAIGEAATGDAGTGDAVTDARVWLLLGLICGDEGEAARAKDLLAGAIRLGNSSFAAHYALGRLLALEGDWHAALAEFKLALAARPSAEAHYVVGVICHQLGRQRTALRHLSKALGLDPKYAAAHYALGLVCVRLGEHERAAEAFAAAHAADKKEPLYRAAKRARLRPGDLSPPGLFGATGRLRRRLLSGGDRRLTLALQEDVLATSLAR